MFRFPLRLFLDARFLHFRQVLTLGVEPALVLAGLLTFPNLLCLPEQYSVALYKQISKMGITAAGTVPDSHRIPLHHGDIGHQIAIFGCKDKAIVVKYQIIA